MGKDNRVISSDTEKYQHVEKKIREKTAKEGEHAAYLEKKRQELKKNLDNKIPVEEQHKKNKIIMQLAEIMKESENNAKIANRYLFEIAKEKISKDRAYKGLYMITVIGKYKTGISCKIENAFRKEIFQISNEEIMNLKKDNLEGAFEVTETFYRGNEKIQKTRKGQPKDFLMEIEKEDSVIIDAENGKIKEVHPDDIIEEIKKYSKENNESIKAKKIQTAMRFLNESKEKIAGGYMKNFFELIRNKLTQRKKRETGKTPKENLDKNRERIIESLRRLLIQEPLYLHKGKDIDKSVIKFLLKKAGIPENKIFTEIDHHEAKNITRGFLFDVGTTANGVRTVETITGKNKKGETEKTRKTILSEHAEPNEKAILNERTTSTSQMIYRMMKVLNLIDEKEKEQMQRFMDFVNTIDSMEYQISAIDYPNNYKKLIGLYRTMYIDDVYKFFKNPSYTGFETLPDYYLEHTKSWMTKNKEKMTLKEISGEQKSKINENIKKFGELKNQGKEVTFKNTKFIVDTKEYLENGNQVAGYHGYGYFAFKKDRGNIYIYSPKELPKRIEGFHTDGHFLIINNATPEKIEKLFKGFSTDTPSLKEEIIAACVKKHGKN